MADHHMPDAAYLRECFDYEPSSGLLTWRRRPVEHFASVETANKWNGRMPGKLAGTPDSEGYQRIWLGRRGCRVGLRAHRIVWTMMTGEKPSMLIDHIDSNGMNNRWENLRQATHQENRNNRWSAGPRLSTGRFPYGVYYERQKYRAVIGLGSFDTVAEAHAAWKDAVRILRGSLACG